MSEDGVVKVKYVQRIKRDDGRVDLYFRKGDHREGPLVSDDGSKELEAEVNAILKRLADAANAAKKPKAGTVGGMLEQYNRSMEFLGLARSTQLQYQYMIDELVEDIGEKHLFEVSRDWIISLRDAWAPRGHRAANNLMNVLKNALKPIISNDQDHRIKGDPFQKVAKVKRAHGKAQARTAWTDQEVEAAIAEAIRRELPGLARAIGLGRWGGFRRGTICRIPIHARTIGRDEDGRPQRRLFWMTEKREVLCDKAEDSRLTDLIETRATANRSMTIAYTANGKPYTERTLTQSLDRMMDALAKKGIVRQAIDAEGNIFCPLTLHGLRHARGMELAEAGSSDAEIMAQLEHATEQAAKIYRAQARRKKLADNGQKKVDNVRSLNEERAKRAAGDQ